MNVLFMAALIALFVVGVNTVLQRITEKKRALLADTDPTDQSKTWHRTTLTTSPQSTPEVDLDERLTRLFQYFVHEGFDSPAKQRVYVDNPLLSEMVAELDAIEPLEWILPQYDIGVYRVKSSQVDEFPQSFTHYIVVNGYRIGFNRGD